MNGEALKEKMKQDAYIYGTHIAGLDGATDTEQIDEIGLDCVFICQERIPLSREQVSVLCQHFASCGISPMVRISCCDKNIAVTAVEGGAEGIVVPYVEELLQIEDIINALKYRPLKGKYLDDIASGDVVPPKKLRDYIREYNKDVYLIAGIESVPAIDNLDSFLDCEDVYGILLEPHNISCSMGLPCEYDNPLFTELVCSTIRRCRENGKPVGVHCDYGMEISRPFLEAGANFIINDSVAEKPVSTIKADFEHIKRVYEKENK